MRKIARFPSLGGKRHRLATSFLVALIVAAPAMADDFSDGTAAFAAGDYLSAASYWQSAADGGSAEAKLQLGLLSDIGEGMPRDPAAAFGYYLAAAQMGLADAAFNVAVMLDAGTDVSRDRVAASVWYARAALAGNKRAALNLGLMYQDGSGVLANDNLAAYWFGSAADTLPAANAALQKLKRNRAGAIVPPVPLAASFLQTKGDARADLVWTSPPGPEGSMFAVQFMTGSASGGTVTTHETLASALQISAVGGVVWRVARIDPANGLYQASAWQHQIDSSGALGPVGLVSFVVNADDDRAQAMVRTLANGLRASGLAVSVSTALQPMESSAIRYRYLDDADLANDLAGLLPGFTSNTVTRMSDAKSGPGEVIVDLVLQPVVSP